MATKRSNVTMDTAKDSSIDPLEVTKEFSSRSAQRASVFICHGPSDIISANLFCKEFEAKGIPCWLSARDMTPKMAWPQCVVEAIESSRFFVLILSADSSTCKDIIPDIVEAKSCGRTILVLQSAPSILDAQLDELLLGSTTLNVSERLTIDDVEAAWAKIVEIETDQTLDNGSVSAIENEIELRNSAQSLFLQLDCKQGKINGKTSYQLAAGDRLVLGRSPEADIYVDDLRASRRHAGLILNRDPKYGLELQLMDLMSRNGTWVRYPREDDTDISKFLEHSQTRITNGAIIRIGSTDIRVTTLLLPSKILRDREMR